MSLCPSDRPLAARIEAESRDLFFWKPPIISFVTQIIAPRRRSRRSRGVETSLPQIPRTLAELHLEMATASDAPASSTITTATDDAEVERDQGNGNGAVSAAPAAVGKEAAAEEEEMIGPAPVPPRPRKKRPLQFEQAFLDALPSAAM